MGAASKANRGLDSSCIKALAPTVASLLHRPCNKPSGEPMESWDLALSNGASWSNIGPFLGNRPQLQSQPNENSKMFPVEKRNHSVIVISLKM